MDLPSPRWTYAAPRPVRLALRVILAVVMLAGVITLASPADAAPAAPDSCNARDKGTKWGITWTAVAGNIDGYLIERTVDGGQSWQGRGRDNVPGSDLGFEDSDNNANAQYRLRAIVDPADVSAPVLCSGAGGGGGGGGGGDTQQPAVPRKPAIVDQAPGNVTLSLQHNGDNVAVTTYRLFRSTTDEFDDATELTIPLTSNPQQHTDNGLTAGNYWYWLKVSDAAGNVSYRSGERPVTITTGGGDGGGGGGGGADTQQPAVPRKPAIVDQAPGNVTLSLQHNGDNVAVTTYRLFRSTTDEFDDATELTIPLTSNPQQHTDNGLTAGNYWYWLKVSDAAGNVSYRSGERPVTITTGGGDGGGGGGGDPVPAGRLTNWDSTGVDGNVAAYPANSDVFNVTNYGATPSNGSDDLAGIQAAIAAAKQNGGGTVYFPNGTYRVSAAIKLGDGSNGIVLEGQSRAAVLEFTNQFAGSAIEFQGRTNLPLSNGTNTPSGSNTDPYLAVIEGVIGSNTITVDARNLDPAVFAAELAGNHAWIDDQNGLQGQVVEIVSATANGSVITATLRDKLEHSFNSSHVFIPFRALNGVGVRSLTIKLPLAGLQANQSAPQLITDVIKLSFTANAFVADVQVGESNANQGIGNRRGQSRAHVLPNVAYRCEVRDSDFTDAAVHGDGGQGYGINFSNNATRCLIENNTFEGLRHSILLHEGATANVVAYNYARNPFHPNHTKGGPADMSFHGFSVANLVEGNVVERIHMSDAGATGQHNTVLRNCLYAGPLTVQRALRGNFVGNAMFGTSDRLRNRQMPPAVGAIKNSSAVVVTPAHPYLDDGSNIFGSNGIRLLDPDNIDNLFSNNWYNGSRSDTGDTIPTSYYNSPYSPLLDNPTSAIASCSNPATVRAGDFADALNGRQN